MSNQKQQTSTRQTREAQHFDQLADSTGEIWWGSVTPAGIRRLERRVVYVQDALAQFHNPTVLELGCGTGAFTKPLLQTIPQLRLTGVDVSPKTIEVIRKYFQENLQARFEVGDVSATMFADNTFDAVIGNSVLHHVPLKETLHESLRILKPGGVLWFSEPNMFNPQIAVEKNVRFVGKWLQNSEDETAFFRWPLARLLRGIGFQDISVQPFDFVHPGIPKQFVKAAESINKVFEHAPLVREIAGSLKVFARKAIV
ncbi:MAG: methyltransferase domain-containing protein [Patescibacteria group bacterium]